MKKKQSQNPQQSRQIFEDRNVNFVRSGMDFFHTAPHVAEELWHTLGHETTVCDAPWPAYNEDYLKENTAVYAISFNGKVRYNLELPADMPKEEVEQAAITHENSAKWMAGKSVKKVIVVPKKIVNIVIG